MEKIAKSEKKKKRKEADDGSGPPKKKKKKEKHAATQEAVDKVEAGTVPAAMEVEVEQTDGDGDTQAPVEEDAAVSSKTEPGQEVIDDDSVAQEDAVGDVPCDQVQEEGAEEPAEPPDTKADEIAAEVADCVEEATPAPAENELKTVRAGYRKRSALSCVFKNGDGQPSSCSTCGGCQSLKRLADKARLDRRAFALETRLLRREMHVLRDHIRMILQPIPHTHLQPFHDYPPVPPALSTVATASGADGLAESTDNGTGQLKVGPEKWRRTASQLDQELEAWWRDDENDWWDDGSYWGDWRAWGPNRRPVQPKWGGKGPRRYNAWGKDSQADLEGRGMRRLNKLPGKADAEDWSSKGKGLSGGKKNGEKAKDEGNGSSENKEEAKND